MSETEGWSQEISDKKSFADKRRRKGNDPLRDSGLLQAKHPSLRESLANAGEDSSAIPPDICGIGRETVGNLFTGDKKTAQAEALAVYFNKIIYLDTGMQDHTIPA